MFVFACGGRDAIWCHGSVTHSISSQPKHTQPVAALIKQKNLCLPSTAYHSLPSFFSSPPDTLKHTVKSRQDQTSSGTGGIRKTHSLTLLIILKKTPGVTISSPPESKDKQTLRENTNHSQILPIAACQHTETPVLTGLQS